MNRNRKRKGVKGGRKKKTEIARLTTGTGVTALSLKENAASQDHETVDDGLINKLNDDCLRVIFSYLSKRQLIGIERVCKRWQEMALSVWSNKTSLTYDEILEITQDVVEFDIRHFKGVLKRCGRYLKKLSLDDSDLSYQLNESIANKIILFICENCKQLNYLKLGYKLLTKKGLLLLETKLACKPNLVTLKIRDCSLIDDIFLKKFIKNAPKLESLSLPGFNYMTGAGLANSKHAFKKLNLNSVGEMTFKNVNKIMDNCSELEKLKGVPCTFSMLSQRPLRDHLVKYEAEFSTFFSDFSIEVLPFCKLRVLKLKQDFSVSNKILSTFHKCFPNLEFLQLSGWCYNREGRPLFNNDGIRILAKVPKLKSFNFGSLKFLSGDALVNLAANSNGRIEVMECPDCDKLIDSEMIKFVSLCPNLKLLDVSFCENITGSFLEGILNSMHLRTSKEQLKIKITDSENCDVSKYQQKHPLLILEESGESEDEDEDGDDFDDLYYPVTDDYELDYDDELDYFYEYYGSDLDYDSDDDDEDEDDDDDDGCFH